LVTYEHEASITDGTNQDHWFRWTDRAFFDDNSHISHFQSIGQDITEHKDILAAMSESETRYRLLAEKMTDIVWIMDMNLRTIYITPSVEATLGFTPEERMAQDINEQMPPAALSLALEKLSKELTLDKDGRADPKRTITTEFEYYHKNGSTIWLENIISGIRDDQGSLIGLHGVSRDITDRKKVQDALRESEKDTGNWLIFCRCRCLRWTKNSTLRPRIRPSLNFSGIRRTT
jgi:PAS domain S-box-containing protein